MKDYELKRSNFSDTGNFGFGIQEHIDLNIKYDPSIGIYGSMLPFSSFCASRYHSLTSRSFPVDFYVILGRPGNRVTKRKYSRSKLGLHQKVTKEEAVKWFKEKYEAVVLNR